MDDNMNRAIGWDEEFTESEPEFQTLPEGDYDFTIMNFERSQYGGSEKIPPCMKITVTFQCTNGVDSGRFDENYYMTHKTIWRFGQLLDAVGLKHKDEPAKPSYIQKGIGLTGRMKVSVRKWTNNGKEYTGNTVKEFYTKSENPMAGFQQVSPTVATPPAAFVQPQPVQQPVQQTVFQQPAYTMPNPAMWQQNK